MQSSDFLRFNAFLSLESGGKNRVKNHWFLTCGARAEKSRKIASKHRVYLAFCLVKTLQIPVFLEGLLWELEVIKVYKSEENTGIYDTF